MSLPKWAEPTVYEYDLGTPTACHNCGSALTEGSTVYNDLDDPGTLYCSTDCVGSVPDCEWCGTPCEDLIEVDDSDPSVGYRSTLLICANCNYKRRIGHYYRPAPGDEDGYEAITEGQDAGLKPRWTNEK